MASRDPRRPPPKPSKHKPEATVTQEELARRENVRRRLFSPAQEDLDVDSPGTSPVDEALDQAQIRYNFNFRTENPTAGTWEWASLSGAPLTVQDSPAPRAGPPQTMPPPRQHRTASSRPARVRTAPRPRLEIHPYRRSRGRPSSRPSTARSNAAVAVPFPEPPGPRPPTRRGWGLPPGVPPPMRPLWAPWVIPQNLEDYDPRDYDYDPKQQ